MKKIEKLFSTKTTINCDNKMSNINLDFIQSSQPSFFVHFAYSNVTEEMISRTLESLNLGSIREITLKPATNKKNETGNSIVVHFDRWQRNPTADKVRQKLISGESIKINYSAKSYLQVIAFQPKVKVQETKPFRNPTITFDDDEDKFGPKLGLNCSEKVVKQRDERPRQERPRQERPRQERPRQERPRQERPRQERPRQERPRDERPRDERPKQVLKRPTTPELPPPEEKEMLPRVYKEHDTAPDVFDLNPEMSSKGIMLTPLRKNKKTLNFQDSPSDDEEEEINIITELDDLYGDLSK